MSVLKELKTDYNCADALVNILIDRATGSYPEENDFVELRNYFTSHPDFSRFLPSWFPPKRSLNQFWNFIKNLFGTYAERREFLWSEFEPLLTRLETGVTSPAEEDITGGLERFNSDEVSRSWRRVLNRASTDPEGAITAARNLLETVLKHILDDLNVAYDHDAIELPDLYRTTAKELNLAPEQHQEQIFKQILGGCAGIVGGLGALRNKLGDAHGKGAARVRPNERHARLSVNLAGSMALFLIETHLNNKA